ncbi:MAG: aspartyl-phosphate phosphatase Spo0E family protein [Lysinibacillus sp.]
MVVDLLLIQMEQTREMMIRSGVENGLQNDETIKLSRKLDKLMNLYYEKKLFENKNSGQRYNYYEQ